MKSRRGHRFWAALACLVVAWGVLFLDRVLELDAAARVPSALVLALLLVCGAMTARARASVRTRAAFATVIVLLTVSIAAREAGRRAEETLQKTWRQDRSEEIAAALHAIGDKIAELEALSSSIGERVDAHLRRHRGDPNADVFATFEVLDSLAAEVARGGVLPAGTMIGIQVFDGSLERSAWAGWPRSLSRLDEALLQSRTDLVYSRRVSLYQILTHIIPLGTGGANAAAVVVDMPLEVNYRVNNRFLKSASLADHISYESVADVAFDYFPVSTTLAERLPWYREMRQRSRERRARQTEAGAGEPGAGGETDRTPVLTRHEFPDHVESVAEVAGNEASGLNGRVTVHSPSGGNPIVGVTATTHPFRHDVDLLSQRYDRWAKTAVVLALLALFVLLMARLREGTSHAMTATRSVVWVVLMAALRYTLLSLGPASRAGGYRIFDPTVFATPALGGIMRSAGDLLITSLFFIATLYGVLKIVRSAGQERGLDGAGIDGGAAPWRVALGAAAIAAIVSGTFEVARRFVGTVVVNANPRLIGETMRLTDAEVAVLHVSVFLMLTGILLAGILLVWGALRGARLGGSGIVWTSILALALLAAVSAAVGRWELALIAVPVLLFVAWAPRFLRREDLVSTVIVAFCLVIISSGTGYLFLTRDYDELRKEFVLEKSDELLDPSDNWKVVILEDLLEQCTTRTDIRRSIRDKEGPDAQRLAFDLWAEGSLSLLGYGCAIHVLDAEDNVVSEFSVDMPYRARIAESGERIDTPDNAEWIVLDLTRATPHGMVRLYRGILEVSDAAGVRATDVRSIGKVIIDLPFFFEALELAARTGPRTPEVLRNVQEGTVAPRVEEPEALLLARVADGQIFESSSENLPVGTRLSESVFRRALDRKWPLLRAGGRTYRIVIHDTESPETFLLAGFAAPSLQRHLLRWSTLFSLYLLFAFAIIVVIVVLGGVRPLRALLPTLTPGGRLGFQQKLLASFLVVALVPALVLGVFALDFIKGRFVDENEQEALAKAFSGRRAFVNLLRGELQFFLGQVDVAAMFAAEATSARPVGERRVAKLFADTGDFLQLGTPPLNVAGALHEVSSEGLFVLWDGGEPYIGVVSAPLRVAGDQWGGAYYVYYARRIDGELLGEVAEQVGADVNIYDGGELVASSREGLLAGGFLSSVMNADAYVKVSMLASAHSLATERAGAYRYQVAYLPLTSWGDGSLFALAADGGWGGVTSGPAETVNAAMSVPLVFRPESYYVEVQKATSIILGVFALLFTATIALGLFLARGIFEPLRALLAGTRRISGGDLSARIGLRRRDEIGTVVTAFDEMAERIAESQRTLEERRRYLEAILENIGTGVVSTDGDDRIRRVNAAGERILGIASDDAVGRTAGELADEGRAPRIFGLLRDARSETRRYVAGEVVLEDEDRKATIKYMLTRLEHEGRYLGTVFVFEDLTELIQSKKLSAWVEMARQIAHEIKNPLTPIRISTQFMRRAYETRPDQFREIFDEGTETIMRQVDVLKRIASEFSSYGRMQQLEVGPHRLDELLRRILAPYEQNETGVALHYENGVPDATVLVDPEAVRKICANLIENALEAMPDGGELLVSCRAEDDADRGRFVRVAFRDTGPGLDRAVSDRLFEPYFSTKTTGTGLGLAICRTLSREMGGDVTVSNLEDGTGVEAVLTLRSG